MVIEVRLYASLRRYRPTDYDNPADNCYVAVDVPDSISIGELLDEMEMDSGEVKSVIVNGAASDLNRILADGDRVSLYPADHVFRSQ